VPNTAAAADLLGQAVNILHPTANFNTTGCLGTSYKRLGEGKFVEFTLTALITTNNQTFQPLFRIEIPGQQ
jgi:hypothetical protein